MPFGPIGGVWSRRILRKLRSRRNCKNLPDAPLELFTFEHYAATAARAYNPYVSTGSGNGPYIVATGVFLAEADLHTYNYWDSLHRGFEPLQCWWAASPWRTCQPADGAGRGRGARGAAAGLAAGCRAADGLVLPPRTVGRAVETGLTVRRDLIFSRRRSSSRLRRWRISFARISTYYSLGHVPGRISGPCGRQNGGVSNLPLFPLYHVAGNLSRSCAASGSGHIRSCRCPWPNNRWVPGLLFGKCSTVLCQRLRRGGVEDNDAVAAPSPAVTIHCSGDLVIVKRAQSIEYHINRHIGEMEGL